jgi:pyridoxal phosphate enzyme (YggS family)
MNTISHNFSLINTQIKQAEIASQRELGTVQLLAVSKTKSASQIAQAYHCGQRHFGENYLQEALIKQQQLAAFDISWHFIGPIQSNKTRAIATHFHWVHSVERLKIATRLSEQRPPYLPPLNICLQVNISDEQTKSGVDLADLAQLVAQVRLLPHLRLRGVMAIPAPQNDYELQRIPYRKIHQAVLGLNLPELDTFSFGMTGDLKAAITEGATIVRIGTALFGNRN